MAMKVQGGRMVPSGFNGGKPLNQAQFNDLDHAMRMIDRIVNELRGEGRTFQTAQLGASAAKLNRAIGLLTEASAEAHERLRNN